MDWSAILQRAGIPESPGRDEAIAATHRRVTARKAAAPMPKSAVESKNTNVNSPRSVQ